MLVSSLCQDEDSDNFSAVYIVTLREAPAVHYDAELRRSSINGVRHGGASERLNIHKPRFRNISRTDRRYSSYIARVHDSLLRRVFRGEKYLKLYSYHYLINGFAVFVTQDQVDKLSRRREVANVVLDFSVRTATTHTPRFLGLPQGAWVQGGGYESAGEGVVIGFIDTGIDPTHSSFDDHTSERPYPVPAHFSGICEVTPDFPSGSCNRKLIAARHFASSAITRGVFNSSQDYASPFDGDGHGTHTASIAAGNHGIRAVVAGHHFGNASGMAPRSHIAVYKALYKSFGGFAADVVAAIDQAAQDGVDIISLSITPNRRPPGIATFFNPLDMALLSAVKAGIFVVQAAGNTGPSPKSMSSFSPWIFTVGSASHDRNYSNSIMLGNNVTITGVGLARLKANYSTSAPKIMYYSARGPDPEDNFLDNADIMKPNLVAPGNSIWAAWSSVGQDSIEFQGEHFAMMSGTSMAAPHVAGLAALVRQKFPNFSPSAIASALSTTASLYDRNGGPIMAQRAYAFPDQNQSPATPFDMGSGFVNATAALNPGLIFDTSYDNYVSFLCGINGSAPVVLNYTGESCWTYNSTINGGDLNLPSITIAKLNQSRTVLRTVRNVAANETYSVGWSAPFGVSLKVSPLHFSIASGETQVLSVFVIATSNSTTASYGRIGLFGHLGHVVNIPLSVIVKITYNTTANG
ncbi:hypothetical protein C1H46_002388 [Malus baccata]|uniref:Peptidase S8/S53 domain-containing protein n=1 Tax=Malus baccata TaxID=106549 RepID=A0A540NLU0_MALBA|nr:hypothetical protein C1H46_002388 [Malus baccata]